MEEDFVSGNLLALVEVHRADGDVKVLEVFGNGFSNTVSGRDDELLRDQASSAGQHPAVVLTTHGSQPRPMTVGSNVSTDDLKRRVSGPKLRGASRQINMYLRSPVFSYGPLCISSRAHGVVLLYGVQGFYGGGART